MYIQGYRHCSWFPFRTWGWIPALKTPRSESQNMKTPLTYSCWSFILCCLAFTVLKGTVEASRSKYFFYCCCLFVFFQIKLHDRIVFYNIIRLQLDPLSISLLIVFQFQTLAHIWLGSTLKPRHNHLTSFRLLLKTGSSAHRSHLDSCHNPFFFFFFWANKIFSFLYCVIVWTWRSPHVSPLKVH